jgi:hypothetical protein
VPTSRGFAPWRFLDAGKLSPLNALVIPASKNLHINGLTWGSKIGALA